MRSLLIIAIALLFSSYAAANPRPSPRGGRSRATSPTESLPAISSPNEQSGRSNSRSSQFQGGGGRNRGPSRYQPSQTRQTNPRGNRDRTAPLPPYSRGPSQSYADGSPGRSSRRRGRQRYEVPQPPSNRRRPQSTYGDSQSPSSRRGSRPQLNDPLRDFPVPPIPQGGGGNRESSRNQPLQPHRTNSRDNDDPTDLPPAYSLHPPVYLSSADAPSGHSGHRSRPQSPLEDFSAPPSPSEPPPPYGDHQSHLSDSSDHTYIETHNFPGLDALRYGRPSPPPPSTYDDIQLAPTSSGWQHHKYWPGTKIPYTKSVKYNQLKKAQRQTRQEAAAAA